MSTHSSARVREQAPHANQTTRTTRTNTIMNALKRRALSVLNDTSIDAESRAIIRYAMDINDPWLAELVRRAEASECVVEAIRDSETPATSEDDPSEDKIEALTEIICSAVDDPKTKSAALLVLMAMLENATHPKALANLAKHLAFTRCGELNLNGMIEAQIAVFEAELLTGEAV